MKGQEPLGATRPDTLVLGDENPTKIIFDVKTSFSVREARLQT